MRKNNKIRTVVFILLLTSVFIAGCSVDSGNHSKENKIVIITSDTILSGMIASLLPRDYYSVEAVLPSGQCPGHYDIKLSDIEKMRKATLNVSFLGMPFLDKADIDNAKQLRIDAGGHNWMVPDSYIHGLHILSVELSKRFADHKQIIMDRERQETHEVKKVSTGILSDIRKSTVFGKPVIVSSMQRETAQWMGFHIVAEYGRPEALSAKDVVRLTKAGKERGAIAVIDNLQSGPDTGRRIAEALGISHVVLSNFPSEKGYLATLKDNAKAVLSTTGQK